MILPVMWRRLTRIEWTRPASWWNRTLVCETLAVMW
jgi:hypothetical protein